MGRYFFAFTLSFGMSILLLGDELMSERIQSVVDEVSELRARYEHSVEQNSACMQQLGEQQRRMDKIAKNEGYDYRLFEENRKRLSMLEAENEELKKASTGGVIAKKELESLHKEIEIIKRENMRLNSSADILVEKNHVLLEQLNRLKRAETKEGEKKENTPELTDLKSAFVKEQQMKIALQERLQMALNEMNKLIQENKALSEKLQDEGLASVAECEPERVIHECQDDNPFPQLMMKEKKEVLPQKEDAEITITVNKTPQVALKPERIITTTGNAYRMNKEAQVYDAPDGKPIELWEEKTSFTSNVFEGDWIKITGHFVDRIWQKSTKDMWVKSEDTLKR